MSLDNSEYLASFDAKVSNFCPISVSKALRIGQIMFFGEMK